MCAEGFNELEIIYIMSFGTDLLLCTSTCRRGVIWIAIGTLYTDFLELHTNPFEHDWWYLVVVQISLHSKKIIHLWTVCAMSNSAYYLVDLYWIVMNMHAGSIVFSVSELIRTQKVLFILDEDRSSCLNNKYLGFYTFEALQVSVNFSERWLCYWICKFVNIGHHEYIYIYMHAYTDVHTYMHKTHIHTYTCTQVFI